MKIQITLVESRKSAKWGQIKAEFAQIAYMKQVGKDWNYY